MMDPQWDLLLPIPIIQEIISFSTHSDKVTFRVTCKRFLNFITNHFFPTFTMTICGTTIGFQDGHFNHAQFYHPYFGALHSSLNTLYISDEYNYVIRKIDLSTNEVTTLCGTPAKHGWKDGIGSESQFFGPRGLALHEKENLLYVADTYNNVIRSINLTNGIVDTIIGNPGESRKPEWKIRNDAVGKEATFSCPCGLALDSISNHLYVADSSNHSIRKIILNERKVETLCGSGREGYKDGSFEDAEFNGPHDIVLNSETQELYVSDTWNHVLRVLSLRGRTVKTLCGTPGVQGHADGSAIQAKFKFPRGLALDSHLQCLYITDKNPVIRKLSLLKEGKVISFCGISNEKGNRDGLFPSFHLPMGIVIDPHSHDLFVIDERTHKVRKIINKKEIL